MINLEPNNQEVKEMYDEICPVQFIEGINDNEEVDNKQAMNLSSYGNIAFPYKPKISYSLTRLEIVLAHRLALPDMASIRVALHSNHNDMPGKVTITEGAVTPEPCKDPNRINYLWQSIELAPVTVIRGNPYWFRLDCNMDIYLVTAQVGEVTALAYKQGTVWKQDTDFQEWKCMLRFYGRVIPIAN